MIVRRALTTITGLTLMAGLARSQSAVTDTSRAPFGLTWGQSQDEVRALGGVLTPQANMQNFGVAAIATNLPRVLSDTNFVALFFGHRDKLWRVFAAGGVVERDPSGSIVLNRYRELVQILNENYGRGHETDVRDTQIYRAPNEYIASIRTGRASRFTSFLTSTMSIELSIRAETMDRASWALIFEHKPGEREFLEDNRNRERQVL